MFSRNPFFSGPRPERPLLRGVIKYVILEYLKDKPSHGYKIIRALEERSHGLYVPSAGTIYPTLQMLEEMGYVISAEQDGKKVYTITDDGRHFLAEQSESEEKIKERFNWENPQNIDGIRKTMHAFGRLAELLRWEVHKTDSEKLGRVREVITRAYEDVDNILKG